MSIAALFLLIASTLLAVQGLQLIPILSANKGSASRAPSSASVETLKKSLRAFSSGTQNGVKASPERRSEIASVIAQLAKANKERKLTSSKKIDGSWKLLYTTNEGSSAGKLGPFIGEVEQAISLDDREYYNYVRLGPGGALVEGKLTATWENRSDKEWLVKFQQLSIKVFGIQVSNSKLEAVGIWRMTYLDDDLRILFAQGGKNTKTENVYVLSK